MEENFNIENIGIPELGNFVQFVGCALCDKKCDGPGEVLSTAGKVLHPGIMCPHYENFRSVNITDKYIAFWGGPFSNFYPCKITIEEDWWGNPIEPVTFKSSEQCFMWYKATNFNDEETAEDIMRAKTPKEAKSLGRKVKNFNEEEWLETREAAMWNAVYQKFKQNPELCRYLINPVTETRNFVEGSPFDKIWGVGISWDDPAIADEKNWKGENLLGKTLDKVRLKLLMGDE